jgi:hypothetical protein
MERLGRIVTEAIVLHYGRDEYLRRLAHPFWFQSFGAVMGMDWHSSGITTSVLHALKTGLAPVASELGLVVCGGRGAHSKKTPAELTAFGDRTGLDGAARATSPTFCERPASARAPSSRSRWWRRSCTARPAASPILRASPSRTAARTGTRSPCRSGSTIGRSAS